MAKAKDGNIAELKQDERNANRHKERGKELLQKSMHELGVGRSVLVDANNVLIAGNNSTETAIAEGITKTVVVETTGDTLVVVKRTDLDLNDPGEAGRKARKMAIVDNSSALAGIDFDIEAVQGIASEWGISPEEWGVDLGSNEDDGTENGEGGNYSRKVKSPVYEAKNEKPEIADLFDSQYTTKLLDEISGADVSEIDKEFLAIAAQRHTVFNYEKIADYYANSSAQVQRLMENSALVVIDFNRAIELGFVKLSNEIAAQYTTDYADED